MATNPYLQDQGQAITDQVTNNLQRRILPGINSAAMATGGFGGSRQGIAQGLAIGDTNQSLSGALAGMYGNAWEGDQNRAVTQQGQKYQYDLGLGGLGLGALNANQNFYNSNRSMDITQMGLGSNMVNGGNLGLTNQGSQLTGIGQQEQNAPWANIGNYAAGIAPFSGLNGSRTDSTPGYGAVQGALAGGMTMAQIIKLMGG